MKKSTYFFNEISDNRGKLVAIEQIKDIPFQIKRIYYIYGTKKDTIRGCHAHKSLEQMLICINGSCKILLDNGINKEVIVLNKKNMGLYSGPNTWREMFDFSNDSVLLVLASDYYSEEDYIRNYKDFLRFINLY